MKCKYEFDPDNLREHIHSLFPSSYSFIYEYDNSLIPIFEDCLREWKKCRYIRKYNVSYVFENNAPQYVHKYVIELSHNGRKRTFIRTSTLTRYMPDK
jgi:hypothetical protein